MRYIKLLVTTATATCTQRLLLVINNVNYLMCDTSSMHV